MAQYIHEDLERNFKKIFGGDNEQVKAKKALSVINDHQFTSEYDSKYTNEYKWTGYGKSL